MWMFGVAVAMANQGRCAVLTGDVLTVSNPIQFASGASDLKDSEAAVGELVCALAAHPEVSVQVEVHTDSQGSETYNTRMSQARADALRAALVQAGVDGTRLTAVGYGELYPLASNQTAEGRLTNRRIEFHTGGGRPPAPALPAPAPAPSPHAVPVSLCAQIDSAVAAATPKSWTRPLPLGPVATQVATCLASEWTQERDGEAVFAERAGWTLSVVSRDGEVHIELEL